MLPDIRAVLAATVAAVGLLMASFALVASFRVAQENRSTTLHASLAERTRAQFVAPAQAAPQRTVMIVETPGPLVVPVPPALDPPIAVKVARVAEAAPEPVRTIRVEMAPIAPIVAAVREEFSLVDLLKDPPMGGPLVAEPPAAKPEVKPDLPRVAAVEPAATDVDTKVAEQKAAERKAAAEKARKARIAREKKKAAARRAAQARAAKQKAGPFGTNQFGNNNTFGGTFTNQQ